MATSFPAPVTAGSRLTAIVTFVVVTGILYFGRDVLIPLALSVLLAFLLAPAVRRLERWRFPRAIAATVTAALSFAVIGAVVWVAASQFLHVAASLPEYKGNIQQKIRSFGQAPGGASIGKATQTIKEIGSEIAAQQEKAAGDGAAAKSRAADRRPMPVIVETSPPGPIDLVKELTAPLIAPLTTAAAVIIFTFIMLLRREDLRDRLIRLVGRDDLNVTTQAIEEAGDRVSRFLRMQLVVNASYGIPVGVALHLLGLPSAALWGLLATTLRFIPYVGSWIAAALPIALAFAISDGWSLVLWTIAVFVVLELVSNNIVEPWLYGASTGLSPIAIIAAAIFWTWLWGAVGLLLATPLTVCLVVLGRYVPKLAFLEILLGDEPVLSPRDRLYQRLLAMDADEATELAETYADEHGVDAMFDELLIPALDLAERDRHRDRLAGERERFVFDAVRRLIEDMRDRGGAPAAGGENPSVANAGERSPNVCIVPARDEADEIVGLMLAQTLARHGVAADVASAATLKSEAMARIAQIAPATICVSALPPAAVLHASALCKRLRAAFADVDIVVALWHPRGSVDTATARLHASGARRVVTTIDAAVGELQHAA